MGSNRHVVVARVSASDGSIAVYDVPRVDPDGDGGRIVECDVDRLLTGPEVAELLGIRASSWRSMVHRKVAPVADEPDAGTVAARRCPRWRLGTVADWNVKRPGRGNRTSKLRGDR